MFNIIKLNRRLFIFFRFDIPRIAGFSPGTMCVPSTILFVSIGDCALISFAVSGSVLNSMVATATMSTHYFIVKLLSSHSYMNILILTMLNLQHEQCELELTRHGDFHKHLLIHKYQPYIQANGFISGQLAKCISFIQTYFYKSPFPFCSFKLCFME